jgi:vacuolar-type H+-ATPase subunit E/Vma4
MGYETLIGTLLREAKDRREAVLARAREEAGRMLAEAAAAADAEASAALERLHAEMAAHRQRTRNRTRQAARRLRLQTQYALIEEAISRAIRNLRDRTPSYLPPLLEELFEQDACRAGECRVLLHERDLPLLRPLLEHRGVPYEAVTREDLLGGAEIHTGDGTLILKNTLATRLEKARSEVLQDLGVFLFEDRG